MPDYYYIYGIIDPRYIEGCRIGINILNGDVMGEIFYIGLSKNPQKRLSRHKSGSSVSSKNLRSFWIAHLMQDGHEINIKIIDEIQTPHYKLARWLEFAYLEFYGKGVDKGICYNFLVNDPWSIRYAPPLYPTLEETVAAIKSLSQLNNYDFESGLISIRKDMRSKMHLIPESIRGVAGIL